MTKIAFAARYADDTPYAYGRLTIRLVDGGSGAALPNGLGVTPRTVNLDADGEAIVDLTPNADISDPVGTFYAVTVNDSTPTVVRYIEVPAPNGSGNSEIPYDWDDDTIQRLVPEPPSSIPAAAQGSVGQVLGIVDDGNGKEYRPSDVGADPSGTAATLAAAAQAFAIARANHTGSQAISTVTGLQTALDAKAPLASPAFTGTPTGITKAHVGLPNVDNTSDATKATTEASAVRTLTNKRIVPRVLAITSSATPAIDVDSYDRVNITALATAITSMTSGLTGTPTAFQQLVIRIKDDGTTRAITWGSSFVNRGVAMPTATTAGKVHMVGFFWNANTSTWDCHAATVEP